MSTPIPQHWQVPEVFRERMGAHAGRQRCMAHAGHLLIIVHDVPDPVTPEKRTAKLFWRDPVGTWLCSAGGAGIGTLQAHVESFIEAAHRLEMQGDHAQSADDWFAVIQRAGPILRTTRNLHRTLQEAREAAKTDKGLITARDLAGDAERAFELIHSHAQEGLRYTSARQAEEQARGAQHMLEAAHRLNMIAAVFLPVTAMATLFSMKFPNGLEGLPAPWTFWTILTLSFSFGLWIKASMPRPRTSAEPQAQARGAKR
ncbi:MAG TPA: hypothetical protein VIK91_26160 [Nannocystis sp.]